MIPQYASDRLAVQLDGRDSRTAYPDFLFHCSSWPYQARNLRPKDERDFRACLPLLRTEAKKWLANQLHQTHPKGHPWLPSLA